MALLQLQGCGRDWYHEAFQVVLKPPWGKKGNIRKMRLEAYSHKSLSLSKNAPASGLNVKVSLSDRCKELHVSFLASPHHSSLLRMSSRRRHEVKIAAGDGWFVTISEWVFARVKDPLVEIDPVTVKKAIMAEKEQTENDSTTTGGDATNSSEDSPPTGESVTSTSFITTSGFPYLPPGIPRGRKGAAAAIGFILLLLAFCTAIIIALRGNQKKSSVAKHSPGENGGIREVRTSEKSGDSNTSFSTTDSDKAARPSPLVTPGFRNPSMTLMPIPSYSSALEKSDLPLPPSFSFSTNSGKPSAAVTAKKDSSPVAAEVEDLVVSFKAPLDDETHLAPPSKEVDTTMETDEEVNEEFPSGAISDELEKEISYLVGESSDLEESDAEESVFEESEGEESDSEYVLVGAATTLLPVGVHCDTAELIGSLSAPAEPIGVPPSPAEPVGALPAQADVGVPMDSILIESASQPLPDIQLTKEDYLPTADAQDVERRREEYTEVLQRVLPAASIGAGAAALTSFSGVDGALQVVGLLAAAGFIARDIVWASEREKLLEDIRSIKDHQQFINFLKRRSIIPDSWSQ